MCSFMKECAGFPSGVKSVLFFYFSFIYFIFAVNAEKFMEHIVTYQDFANNPGIIEDPSLVICINSKYVVELDICFLLIQFALQNICCMTVNVFI